MTDHAKEGEGNAIKVVVVTNPDVLHQVLDAQKAGGMPTDRTSMNDGFVVAQGGDRGIVPKTEPGQFSVYAVAYGGLPQDGIGSRRDVDDAVAFYQERYPMNQQFNNEVLNTLRT